MQSTLNPNVKPFPAYIPSPIAPPKTLSTSNSNSNPNTNSPPSMASSWSTHHSRSPNTLSTPFPTYQATPNPNGNGNGNEVKQFGQGWKTTYTAPSVVKHNASMSELKQDHKPIRTRSPSMPDISSLNILGESDPIVPFQSRDRYKHLQIPITDNQRVSRYDPVNGHSYNHNHNQTLGHVASNPDLVGGYGQGYRRSSLVTSWRDNIPEDSEVEHHTPTHGRFDTHIRPDQGHNHTLANSRSVPAFATSAIAAGLSPTGQPTQSRNIYISSLPAHVTYDQLFRDAEQFGETMSVKLDSSPSATSRAYVMFKNVYDTHEYYTYLKRQRPGWTCELAKEDYGVIYKSLEDKTSSNLYIQGFTAEDNMEYIQSVLYPGKIVSYSRPRDDSNNIRGIVMARVQSRPQADEVIERLHGRWIHPMTGQALEIRIADSEAQKQYKKLNSSQLDGRSSMPNMRNSNYGQTQSSEANWFANPSRESSYSSLRTTSMPRTSQISRVRQPSNLSFGNTPWSSRTDNQWNAGEPSTPTSQYFGVSHSQTQRLGHRESNEKLDMEHVRCIWPEQSTGC